MNLVSIREESQPHLLLSWLVEKNIKKMNISGNISVSLRLEKVILNKHYCHLHSDEDTKSRTENR